VYVLKPNAEDFQKLEGKRVGRTNEYTAPSDCIIVHIGSTYLHISVGKDITQESLKNLINVALKQKKPVKLESCESLKNLQAVDQVIMRINEFMGFKDILI
jgi:hypothetical protein